ncbi:MAG: hypothetical protein NW226_17435 [Microscillaceae bacterium]|nr:hypothetical protein [Microscillaceae bacterium]
MSEGYYSLNIDGYVVEVSQSKNYIRIIGDLKRESSNSIEVIASELCFQITIRESTFLDENTANDLILRHHVRIEGVALDPEYEKQFASLYETYPETVILIEKYQGLSIHASQVGVEELAEYLKETYVLPEWSGVENSVWVQGVVIHKSDRILRLMTDITDPNNAVSYQCFEVNLTEDTYEKVEHELEQTEVGDTLLVKGSLFYLDPSFKHTSFTYDFKPELRKKVILHIQGDTLVKLPSVNKKIILTYFDYYLKDQFRLGQYGDDNKIEGSYGEVDSNY